ncbi:MAG: RNA 2',3'-cyclic phosphodiesterase [Candidatus Poribacteria bacterium]|nr:MAG: RNA 2',3'-cyclic phosphodiesterase [Candidatus Poribacteria bacterium]
MGSGDASLKRRLFVALMFPPSVQEEIAKRCAEWGELKQAFGGRFAREFHITLKFLGAVSEEQIERLDEAFRAALEGMVSFPVTAGELGAFPTASVARVLWWGTAEGTEPLQEAARRVERAAEPFGFPPEGRPFVPHVTLARFRRPAALRRWIEQRNWELQTGSRQGFSEFQALEFALVESRLRPEGPLYTPLATYRLAAA